MSNFDPKRYTIAIKLVTLEEGEYFEAVVAELPDLVEYGNSHDEAYSLAVEAIEGLREDAMEQNREFPEPIRSQTPNNEFSGRVTLRMSKSLHASVSNLADRDGVSLNSWIVEAISIHTGANWQLKNKEDNHLSNFNRIIFSTEKYTSHGTTTENDTSYPEISQIFGCYNEDSSTKNCDEKDLHIIH